jgi:DNA-binding IclR family transcriptional regulator
MRGSGLGKSTTHRYAMSLRKEGLLRYDPESALYSLGAALIRMGRLAEEGLHITEAAGPHMDRLAAETNATIALAIPDAGSAVVVKVVYPPRAGVFTGVKVGSRQASRSAQALAMRAAEQRGVSRDPKVAEVQQNGYAFVDYPQIGISAVACAIVHGGDLLATMAAVGTTTTIADKIESIAQGLRLAARRIAEDLGEPRA